MLRIMCKKNTMYAGFFCIEYRISSNIFASFAGQGYLQLLLFRKSSIFVVGFR
jgi:hypothetical protein